MDNKLQMRLEIDENEKKILDLQKKVNKFKNKLKDNKSKSFKKIIEMNQEEQLKYAMENFRIEQDFTDEFTMKYEDYEILEKFRWNYLRDYTITGPTYLLKNKQNRKQYIIMITEYDEDWIFDEYNDNKSNEYYIYCEYDWFYNNFIEKYPDVKIDNLVYDKEKTYELNQNFNAHLEKNDFNLYFPFYGKRVFKLKTEDKSESKLSTYIFDGNMSDSHFTEYWI